MGAIARTVPLAFAYYAKGGRYERMAAESMATLRRAVPGADVRVVDPDALPAVLKDCAALHRPYRVSKENPRNTAWSYAMRLGIPLSEQFADCRRVLWLDSDTRVVSGEVASLADMDMEGCETAMSPDCMPIMVTGVARLAKGLGRQARPGYYCNSGVCLFDLTHPGWPAVMDDMVEVMERHFEILDLFDQDLLNVCCRVKILDPKFNCRSSWHFGDGAFMRDPVILHYYGPQDQARFWEDVPTV